MAKQRDSYFDQPSRGAAFDELRRVLVEKEVEELAPEYFSHADKVTTRQIAALLYMKSSVQTPYRTAIHYAAMCAVGAVREMMKAT